MPSNPTLQAPLNTPYGHFAKPEDVIQGIDLTGKHAVITAGHSGIGLWTTKTLVGAGAHVTVLARNIKRAHRHLRNVPNVQILPFDLLKPDTIDAAADTIVQSGRPVHMLITSAGVIGLPLLHDPRGYEYHLATNHLGHFQLVSRLYPALQRADGARVVLVSSRGHRWGGVLFDDPGFTHTAYTPNRAYAQSKSAIALFAVQLDALARQHNIRAFAAHPGPIPSSDLFAESLVGIRPGYQVGLMRLSARLMRGLHITPLLNAIRRPQTGDAFKTIRQGAATLVWCATSPALEGKGGVYCEDCDIAQAEPGDSDAPYGVRPWAIDEELAEECWALSERMTGISFSIS